jgi:hypothetical protein
MLATLKMKCNPEHTRDFADNPACAVMVPWTGGAQTQWVCAALDLVQSPAHATDRHHQGRHVFKFDREMVFTFKVNPFNVRDFEFYTYFGNRIREGSLLPADEATAKEFGLEWPLDPKHGWCKLSDHPLTPLFAEAVKLRADELLAGPKGKGAPAAAAAPAKAAAPASKGDKS